MRTFSPGLRFHFEMAYPFCYLRFWYILEELCILQQPSYISHYIVSPDSNVFSLVIPKIMRFTYISIVGFRDIVKGIYCIFR